MASIALSFVGILDRRATGKPALRRDSKRCKLVSIFELLANTKLAGAMRIDLLGRVYWLSALPEKAETENTSKSSCCRRNMDGQRNFSQRSQRKKWVCDESYLRQTAAPGPISMTSMWDCAAISARAAGCFCDGPVTWVGVGACSTTRQKAQK